MVYEYPLALPPGRNGLTPDIKLTYNSETTQEDNLYGFGWTDTIPYIARINRKGSSTMYTDNYFVSSIDGELVSTSTTTYAAKVEKGSFNKYALSGNTWTVVDKNGTTYTFGSDSTGRQDDPNDSTRAYKWMLQDQRDTNNNYIKYTYFKDSGQIYPSQITYTGNGTTDGPFMVTFQRTARNDVLTTEEPAFAITTNYIINEIDANISGSSVRKFLLATSIGDNGTRSHLTSVTGYHNPTIGRFLSEDPAVLDIGDPNQLATDTGQLQAAYLADPQFLNSYSYVGNSPINKIDPTGKFFGIDDAISFCIGGLIGSGIQLGVSLATHQHITWSKEIGAFVSGGIAGVGVDNAPVTGGTSLAITYAAIVGGTSAAAGNLTEQEMDVASGTQKSLNGKKLGFDTAFGAVTGGVTEGLLPEASIPGLSSGRGNFNAIGKSIQTKLAEGLIGNVSSLTALKSAMGSQAADAYKTIGGAVAEVLRGMVGNKLMDNK